MGKLHELLAVESELASRANAAIKATKELFGQPQKLLGMIKKYRPFEDTGKSQPDEITNLSTTVEQQLKPLFSSFGSWLDASVQKEVTNQQTKAVVEFGDTKFELPAPALLNLESKLAALRDVLGSIPTNDTTERWEWDTEGQSYVSAPRFTFRTEKLPKAFVAYEATKEHPAQVQVFTEDVRIGEYTTIIKSGMLSPSQKREVLDRLDKVLVAVKKARVRANDIEVVDVRISTTLLAYIWE